MWSSLSTTIYDMIIYFREDKPGPIDEHDRLHSVTIHSKFRSENHHNISKLLLEKSTMLKLRQATGLEQFRIFGRYLDSHLLTHLGK